MRSLREVSDEMCSDNKMLVPNANDDLAPHLGQSPRPGGSSQVSVQYVPRGEKTGLVSQQPQINSLKDGLTSLPWLKCLFMWSDQCQDWL